MSETYNIIPNDVINKILEYDGRIKYKDGKYINIIHKHDKRYNVLKNQIDKKIHILKTIEIYYDELKGHSFYFEISLPLPKYIFCFENSENSSVIQERITLAYDYNNLYEDKLEICYCDFRCGVLQIRTCI